MAGPAPAEQEPCSPAALPPQPDTAQVAAVLPDETGSAQIPSPTRAPESSFPATQQDATQPEPSMPTATAPEAPKQTEPPTPAIAKGPPAVPCSVLPPPVPDKPTEAEATATPNRQDAMATLLATLITQMAAQGGTPDMTKLTALAESLKAPPTQSATQSADAAKAPAAAECVNGPTLPPSNSVAQAKTDPPPPLPAPAAAAPPPPAKAAPIDPTRVNSSSHPTEWKGFMRFCEKNPGADELKKAWNAGGAKRMAAFTKYVLTGCDPLALECAMRFKRQREETDEDAGEYYPWKDIVAFHGGDADDEIAIDVGCNPSYAASVCAMLESGNGAVPSVLAGGTDPAILPPPPKNGKQNKTAIADGSPQTTNTEQPANKKARAAKPEGSELELHVCGDDTEAFVKNWVQAANAIGVSLHGDEGTGDWKHKREWLQQQRCGSYMGGILALSTLIFCTVFGRGQRVTQMSYLAQRLCDLAESVPELRVAAVNAWAINQFNCRLDRCLDAFTAIPTWFLLPCTNCGRSTISSIAK
ncbi:hypothetical protein AK812_SmicGene44064 [Symbiodinium microadriaticum]|uniref:Uncharacterized protein n=1 Tax=Symbiodinium microadriaticum TaxID=2951 RepID=A0A1Q9BZE8_SYMMI|nr:hypothetical protein AK812_SmicGene44064 [Symbiodinium microadriaticum]CAE7339382.1 unnamed protein product [Symbiodinium microadriaticum]